MPAIVELTDIRIEPQPRSAADHVELCGACRNHGDAPTGRFVVRFDLDGREKFDAPIAGVPPHETVWARWSHLPLSEGPHVVHGVLDLHGAAADLDPPGHGTITRYFAVSPAPVAPQDVRGDQYLDHTALINAFVALIDDRITGWVDVAARSVREFAIAARGRIRDADLTGDTQFDFDQVLWAFVSTVMFSESSVNTALGILGERVDLMSTLQQHFGSGYLTEFGAKNKLYRAIDDLERAVGRSLRESVAGVAARLGARLEPNSTDEPLTGIEWGSTDPLYLTALCDRLGVEEPSEANAVGPIRQALEAQFEIAFRDVERLLER